MIQIIGIIKLSRLGLIVGNKKNTNFGLFIYIFNKNKVYQISFVGKKNTLTNHKLTCCIGMINYVKKLQSKHVTSDNHALVESMVHTSTHGKMGFPWILSLYSITKMDRTTVKIMVKLFKTGL